MKIKLIKVKNVVKDLKLGDIVLTEDNSLGFVKKTGKTFLHEHFFVKICWKENNGRVYTILYLKEHETTNPIFKLVYGKKT